MTLRLLSPNAQFPPDGWGWTDPKTGFSINGFQGTPAMQVNKAIAHRRANPHIYPPEEKQHFDPAFVIQELFQQKAAAHPELFVDSDAPVIPTPEIYAVAGSSSACSCGETASTPEYCASCAGQRIVGYKCVKCGKVRHS